MSIARDAKTQISGIGIFKDLRPSQPFKGSLFEVADWIAGHVLKPLVVEADTGFAIRVLRDAVDYVTASVKQLQSKELEDIFGGKSVFENVLQYEEGRYPLEEMRRAATYLLVNQLLFYHVLTRVDASFAVIDEDKIRRPGDLRAYFEPVLRKDYSSVFGFDVASRLPESAVEAVKKAVIAVKALAPEKIRHDLLGKVFHELIPFEIRKAVAAFYTNNEAAEILAQLAIDKPDAKVIDLACGSGTLLVAAYRRKQELLKKERGGFTLEDHKRFLEHDLTGIDIMPFAAHMAVVHLSLQALAAGHETEKVRIAVWDSTELEPEQTIPAISRELKEAYKRPTLETFMKGIPSENEAYVQKGAVSLEGMGGEEIPLEKVDVIIMNPPFTRERRIPRAYKDTLLRRFKEYDEYLHGQLGFYGYFTFLADKFAKANGRLALVLPTSLLRIPAARDLRSFLAENYNFEYIITTLQKSAFSEGARFREMLLIVKKTNHNRKSTKCSIVTLKRLPGGLEEAAKCAQQIKKNIEFLDVNGAFDNEVMNIRVIAQEDLKETVDNVFALVSVSDTQAVKLIKSILNRGSQRISELGAYLKKIEGRYYRFDTWFGGHKLHEAFICHPSRAIKKIDKWIIRQVQESNVIAENKFTHEELVIPQNVIRYGLRRPSGTGTIDVSTRLDYIIINSFPQFEQLFEEREVKKLLKILPKWKQFLEEKLGNVLFTQDVNISAPGTKLLAYYSATPTVGEHMWSLKVVPDEIAKIIVLWLNSSLYILWSLVNRVEVEGAWMKFHRYLVDNSPVINPEQLKETEREMLLTTFEKIKDVDFPSILEQLKNRFWARVEVDEVILKALGFSKEETNQLLDYLYPTLAKEIEQLKTLMQG